MPEIEHMIGALRDREHRANKFAAALKGVDIEGDSKDGRSVEERFEAVKSRAEARLRGVSAQQQENDEISRMFGIEFEIEE